MDQQPTLILVGAAGSGKGTQAKKIVTEYGYDLVEAGAILRHTISLGTETGKKIAAIIDDGGHLSDEFVTQIMHEYVTEQDHQGKLLVDGYPRSIGQAKLFKQMLSEMDMDPENYLTIWIDVPREISEERLMSRSDEKGKRKDDTPSGIKHRLDHFDSVIVPMIDMYMKEGKTLKINGNQSVDEVFKDIKQYLDPILKT